ncbi:PaaD-like zinc ribbon domain-containing protein, partial [Streptomyces phytophilus]
VRCPHCGSAETELLSPFSSTACKALRRCTACLEPFDHFKELT